MNMSRSVTFSLDFYVLYIVQLVPNRAKRFIYPYILIYPSKRSCKFQVEGMFLENSIKESEAVACLSLILHTLIPLISRNRQFFAHFGARKLMVREFLKYHFRPEFDGILQYFSPP